MNIAVQNERMKSLAELRGALPSMRRGQLIANMATVARSPVAGAIWEMEDDELLAAIRWRLQQLSALAAAGGTEASSHALKGREAGECLQSLYAFAGFAIQPIRIDSEFLPVFRCER